MGRFSFKLLYLQPGTACTDPMGGCGNVVFNEILLQNPVQPVAPHAGGLAIK